jgi:hypothetical protein
VNLNNKGKASFLVGNQNNYIMSSQCSAEEYLAQKSTPSLPNPLASKYRSNARMTGSYIENPYN